MIRKQNGGGRVNKVKKANLLLLIVMIVVLFCPIVLKSLPDWSGEYVYILLPVILFMLIQRRNFKKTLRLNSMNLQSLFIVLGISLLMQPFLLFISAAASQLLGNQLEALLEEGPKYSFMMTMFVMAVTPAICEEALMRGVILDGYEEVSIKKAAIMNGLLFGMFHLNFHQFAYTFFMGIVLAYVVYITNSIWSAIIIHFINNSTSVFMMSLSKSTASTAAAANSGQTDTMAFWIFFMVVGLGFAALVILLIKRLIRVNNVDLNTKYVKNLEDNFQYEMVLEEPRLFNWPLAIIIVIFMITSMLITLAMLFM